MNLKKNYTQFIKNTNGNKLLILLYIINYIIVFITIKTTNNTKSKLFLHHFF